MQHSLDHVQYVIERDGHQVHVFTANQGVLSNGMFKIVTPEVGKHLLQQKVKAEFTSTRELGLYIGPSIETQAQSTPLY